MEDTPEVQGRGISGLNCTEAVEEMRRYIIRYGDRNWWQIVRYILEGKDFKDDPKVFGLSN